jgi:SAM-dependent methyltransferase
VKTQDANPEELSAIYSRRFDENQEYRNAVWRIIIGRVFQGYAGPKDSVLDLGCGYGQFINQIQCGQKLAMDLNPRSASFLNPDVRFLQQDCSHRWDVDDASLDLVFTSNFFEHLPTKDSLSATVAQIRRCLRPAGRVIAMGPNIKYINGAYWDFWDHHLPLTELSMCELLETGGFTIERAESRFLPYTMVGKRNSPLLFISLYLQMPFFWKFFGRQFLIVASNGTAAADR